MTVNLRISYRTESLMDSQPQPENESPPQSLTKAGARLGTDSRTKSMLVFAVLGAVAAFGVLLMAWSQLADDNSPQVVRGTPKAEFACEVSNNEDGQRADCVVASETTLLKLPAVEGVPANPDPEAPLVTSPPTAVPEVEPGAVSAGESDCIVAYLAERFSPEEFVKFAENPQAEGYETWVAAASEANIECGIGGVAP